MFVCLLVFRMPFLLCIQPPSDNLLEAAKVGLSECKTLKKLRIRKFDPSLTKTVLTSVSRPLEEVELKYCHFGMVHISYECLQTVW